MSLLVRAFPLVGSPADLQAMIAELDGARDAQRDAFYQAHGVTHESWYLQQTPQGSLVIGLTQVRDVATASSAFAQSQEGFALWFKQQIQRLSGVDPSRMPEGPATQLVYEWSDTEATRQQFAPPGF